MKKFKKSGILMAAAAAALSVTFAVAVASRISENTPAQKTPPPIPTYTSADDQRKAEQDAAHRVDPKEADFRAQFGTGKKDLHSLPSGPGISTQTTSWGPLLSDAARGARTIVRAIVQSQAVGDGFVDSTVAVTDWIKGSPQPTELRVRQVGGPVWNNGNPGLGQLVNDPLLWTGREYVLFISDCLGEWAALSAAEGFVCTGFAGRQLEVDAATGTLKAVNATEGEEWAKAVQSQRVDEFLPTVRAAVAKLGR